jgi:hypothetical protein
LSDLSLKYPWLADSRRFEGFLHLLRDAENSAGNAGTNLLYDLIPRIHFLFSNGYDDAIATIANYITSTFDVAKIVLCATTADHTKDSAQRVLYDVVSAIGMLGYDKVNSANRYDCVTKKYGAQVTDIVLLDEFLGTGRSLRGRASSIQRHYRDKNLKCPPIHVFVIAGMESGLRSVEPFVSSIFPVFALKPGIRGYAEKKALPFLYQTLDSLEKLLAPIVENIEMPAHGDGGCESLYARHFGNCPNSVLPMFWWPVASNGTRRKTLFSRVF